MPAEPLRSSEVCAGGAARQPEPHALCPSLGRRGAREPGTSGFPGETAWTADGMLGLRGTDPGRGEGPTGRLLLLALQQIKPQTGSDSSRHGASGCLGDEGVALS